MVKKKAVEAPEAGKPVGPYSQAVAVEDWIFVSGEKGVDPKGKNGIAESMGAFEAAAAEKEFAEKAYASAWAAVELARSDASRQHRYLVEIAEPSKPDESTYPRRAMAVLTVFLVSLVCMGIGTLLVAAVREHARV